MLYCFSNKVNRIPVNRAIKYNKQTNKTVIILLIITYLLLVRYYCQEVINFVSREIYLIILIQNHYCLSKQTF